MPHQISNLSFKEKLTCRQFWLLNNQVNRLVQQVCIKENITIEPIDILNIFCSADPSENNSNVQWLITTYCNNGFLFEDILQGVKSKVYDTIVLFLKYRKLLKLEQKNIYNYKSLSDLYSAIQTYDGNSNLFQQTIEFQTKFKAKEDATNNSLTVYDQAGLKIVVPLTEQSAQWWGQGTQWCTAATKSENYFESYNQSAPLIVVMFNQTLKDKVKLRKFQFYATKYNLQFMNERDQTVNKSFVHKHWQLFEPLIVWGFKITTSAFEYILPSQITQEHLNMFYLNQDDLNVNLEFVPNRLKTKDFCEQAVKGVGTNIRYVPKDLQTEKTCLYAIEHSPVLIPDCNLKFFTTEFCKAITLRDSRVLIYLPEQFKNASLYLTASQSANIELKLIPEKFRTHEICLNALKSNGRNQLLVDPYSISYEEYKEILKHQKLDLKKIPIEFLDYNFCKLALQTNPQYIVDIPEQVLKKDQQTTEKLWTIVLKHNPKLLSEDILWRIPKFMLTPKLCLRLIKNCPYFLRIMPEYLITKSICSWAVRTDIGYIRYLSNLDHIKAALNYKPNAMNYLNEKYIDELNEQTWTKVLKANPLLVQRLPQNKFNLKICTLVISLDSRCLQFIPEHFKTAQLCADAFEQLWTSFEFFSNQLKTQKFCDLYVKRLVQTDRVSNLKDIYLHIPGTCFSPFIKQTIEQLQTKEKPENKVLSWNLQQTKNEFEQILTKQNLNKQDSYVISDESSVTDNFDVKI